MPSHERTASDESALTSLSSGESTTGDANASFSSDSSQISARSSQFTLEVETVIESPITLTHLVDRATELIAKLASNEDYNKPLFSPPKSKIKLDRILTSMLHYAYDCGGEGGKRYTASAIYSCHRKDDKETLGYIQSLATTWLSHLLFVCKQRYLFCCLTYSKLLSTVKANGSHKSQFNPNPSDNATPTRGGTAQQMDIGAPNDREKRFKSAVCTAFIFIYSRILIVTKLLKRDGYRCKATGMPDIEHPSLPPNEEDNMVGTIGCHILRRAIAVFDGGVNHQSKSVSFPVI